MSYGSLNRYLRDKYSKPHEFVASTREPDICAGCGTPRDSELHKTIEQPEQVHPPHLGCCGCRKPAI